MKHFKNLALALLLPLGAGDTISTLRGNNIPGTGVNLVFYSYDPSNGNACDNWSSGELAPYQNQGFTSRCPGDGNTFWASWFTCSNEELNASGTQLCIETTVNGVSGDGTRCCTGPGGNQPVISYDGDSGSFSCQNGATEYWGWGACE